jgi:hypothetical protein
MDAMVNLTRVSILLIFASFASAAFSGPPVLINAESGSARSLDGIWDRPCGGSGPDQSERWVFLGDTVEVLFLTYTSTDGTCSSGEVSTTFATGTIAALEDFTTLGWGHSQDTQVPPPLRQDSTAPLASNPTVTKLIITVSTGPLAGTYAHFFYMDDTATPWLLYGQGGPDDSTTYSDYVTDEDPWQKSNVLPVPASVTIDIKPGNKHNKIKPHSKGKIWVAILSNIDTAFDPLQIDISTVQFGNDDAEPIRHRVQDFNRDGLPDLLLQFKIRETGLACGDTEATLIGETFDGLSITGMDTVKTVGCK